MTDRAPAGLGWLSILRLGLVQSALGSIVVLMTSTLNRVMVVELALPAVLPGALIALHYIVQIARPRFGYGSDRAVRRSAWIVGGMAVLTVGAIGAAGATWLMRAHPVAGVMLALAAFIAVGGGVGAAGTALLALLARKVAPARRGAAAAVVWLMMIAGIIITAGAGGALLEPFSMSRLFTVVSVIAVIGWGLSVVAVLGIESRADAGPAPAAARPGDFRKALAGVWADGHARIFTGFVFVSMLAYSMQDLILEPFAGLAFHMSPGQTTQLTGVLHGGVLFGMLAVGALASGIVVPRVGTLRGWAMAGCAASAAALATLAAAACYGPPWPIHETVFALGAANGAFAVAAIALMMGLAGNDDRGAGTRVGLWGAAQALAFGLGGLIGTGGVDALGDLFVHTFLAYAIVFSAQAILFVAAGLLMLRIQPGTSAESHSPLGKA